VTKNFKIDFIVLGMSKANKKEAEQGAQESIHKVKVYFHVRIFIDSLSKIPCFKSRNGHEEHDLRLFQYQDPFEGYEGMTGLIMLAFFPVLIPLFTF
jgi:hypothetical protein